MNSTTGTADRESKKFTWLFWIGLLLLAISGQRPIFEFLGINVKIAISSYSFAYISSWSHNYGKIICELKCHWFSWTAIVSGIIVTVIAVTFARLHRSTEERFPKKRVSALVAGSAWCMLHGFGFVGPSPCDKEIMGWYFEAECQLPHHHTPFLPSQ